MRDLFGRTICIERLPLDGRKKNDNQGSAGVVGNLDVPASPVLLLSIATHVISYCRDGVAVSGRKVAKYDPGIVGMNRKFRCNMEIVFAPWRRP